MTTGKRGRPRTPIVHGTEAGYRKHLRYGPPIGADDECGCRTAASQAVILRIRGQARQVAVTVDPSQPVAPPKVPPTQVEMAALETVLRYARTKDEFQEMLDMLGIEAAA